MFAVGSSDSWAPAPSSGPGSRFFALAFDTYVPRWTGLVRFGQYLPLLAGMGMTFAFAGYLRLWSWLAEVRIPRSLPLVAALVGVIWLVPVATTRYAAELRLPPDGQAALEALRTTGSSGDVVLSNALTTGTIEAFSGLEVPLEGRQPLIEDAEFLESANQLLLEAHEWFVQPTSRALLDRLGVRWVLVADDPAVLGTTGTLGGSVGTVEAIGGLTRVWSGVGIALFELPQPVTANAVTDSVQPVVNVARSAVVIAVGVALVVLLVVPWRRRRRADPDAGPS